MDAHTQKVTQLISQACNQYPGGLSAVFDAIKDRDGCSRAKATFYADFNPNPTTNGKMKVCDFVSAMQITGDITALRYLAGMFGFSLAPLVNVEPDAPTLEGEMLHDYPAVADFHGAIKANASEYVILTKLRLAINDLEQTAVMAMREQNKK